MFDQIRDALVDSVREKIVDRGLMQHPVAQPSAFSGTEGNGGGQISQR